ncbi:hypothetical protein KP509_02G006600 [Ceratopteris richardii]|uniref:SEC7 domain-containing protein n=1 Tax=Ceratopteris richardii TaxID=49495 RepID=A0A8T2VEN0_CERRI|nr:hypothetical protein KP509_02G006600 [Ceratopteris richardii]
MVNAEIGAVLAVMRRNARWAGRYMGGDDQLEHSLVYSLKTLRRSIFSWQQPWIKINPCLYLTPFLDVVRSDETGAPITGVALSAVYKILSLEVFDSQTAHVDEAMHEIVDAVTKGELLQRTARHSMHEIVRSIFAHLPDLDPSLKLLTSPGSSSFGNESGDIANGSHNDNADLAKISSVSSNGLEAESVDGTWPRADGIPATVSGDVSEGRKENGQIIDHDLGNKVHLIIQPYGIVGIVEIFRYLCSLLNIVDSGMVTGQNLLAIDEDVPLFALGLINSAVELGGSSFGCHPELIALFQDDLFRFLMQLGLSNMNPLILSMVCSIVLNLYHHLRSHLKLQLEAFFSCVVIRLAQGKYGASYQQQEVAMEALVDFCRQSTFMPEMYANFDCDITCGNIFEELGNLLSKSAFPVNCPLSAMHILALEGLIAVIHSMAERAGASGSIIPVLEVANPNETREYVPFWTLKCENYKDPKSWVKFVQRQKYIKRRLMIGADHFNRDPKKGLEFLQGIRLLPEKLDPQSVACFFRYTTGLDKSLLGDFLGDPDEFCLQVLAEFARTFDFQGMTLDAAMRTFLETFRLPGEAQKIHRVLEAFAGRYYEQSNQILADKDAAFLLAYSLIMLNTDQHNSQVKKKMTEEDFIKNNRSINGGQDLPREVLSELYHSIVRNEIKISYDNSSGIVEMTPSRWVGLIYRSQKSSPYIKCDSRPFLDRDMFAIISGPTIAAISVVFDHAEDEDVLRMCVEGFLAVAKISSSHHLEDVLDDLVVSLCKFTTLLNPTSSVDEPILAFGDDTKARMAAVTVFNIVNKYGDYIRTSWRNILDCILRLHKLGLLPARVVSDAEDDVEGIGDSMHGRPITGGPTLIAIPQGGAKKRSQGLMGRFSQLLSLETDEPRSQPTEQQLAAHQRTLRAIEACRIDSIITESKFLQAESLLQLVRALLWAAGRPQKAGGSPEDEDTAVFCLDLLIAVALNNRDRIMLLWQVVYEHIANIVQTTLMPCLLVEKAVFGLLRICQRLLPYKEDLAEELLRSLQLILKLDARVADAFCERITQEVMQLVKTNAKHIKSPMGWRTVSSLLSITARHYEASEVGFEALSFIMAEGAHLTPANYVLCLDAARAFAEVSVGGNERSIRALDLMTESIKCLIQWSGGAGDEETVSNSQELGEMWMRLAHGLRKVCREPREEVRNHAILSLQRSLSAAENMHLPPSFWLQSFDQVIFVMLDDLLDIALEHSQKEYRNMENTLHFAMKLVSKTFLQFLDQLILLPGFRALWLSVLSRMNRYRKAKLRGKDSEKIQELIPELLKNMLLIMKNRGVLVQRSTIGCDSLWELTWHHVQDISPSLQAELLPQWEESQEMGSVESEMDIGTGNAA